MQRVNEVTTCTSAVRLPFHQAVLVSLLILQIRSLTANSGHFFFAGTPSADIPRHKKNHMTRSKPAGGLLDAEQRTTTRRTTDDGRRHRHVKAKEPSSSLVCCCCVPAATPQFCSLYRFERPRSVETSKKRSSKKCANATAENRSLGTLKSEKLTVQNGKKIKVRVSE